jgi:hypothetical protein
MSNTSRPARTAPAPAPSPRRSTTERALAALAAGALVTLCTTACSKPAPPTEEGDGRSAVLSNQPDPDRPDPQEPTMTQVKDAAGIASNDGQVVELVGRYAVVDTGRHKIMYEREDGSTGATNKVVRLVLADLTNVDLWVRPEEEMADLTGKTVVATGKMIAKSTRKGPGAQPDPGPTLVEITKIVAQ